MFRYRRLISRNRYEIVARHYLTLVNTLAIASESSTVRISLPRLTTTKGRTSGTGLLGVLTTAVPVQSGLTA